MKKSGISRCLKTATAAVRAVGDLMRRNLASTSKSVDLETQHDIKLELDSRSQRLIERTLLREHPEVAVLGEEGTVGDVGSEWRWVVDPIDGTVNFAYGLPHACVSIALQRRIRPARPSLARAYPDLNYETVVGVVYDPFQDELWTAVLGQAARMNGRKISVGSRSRLDQSIVGMGFAKYASTLNAMLPVFNQLIHKVRKVRILGAAALSMTYVATGRLDAYMEPGIRLWDIAAGGLIVECAGGEFWRRPIPGEHTYEILANNGKLRRALERVKRKAKA